MLDLIDAFLPQLVGWSVAWLAASVVGLWIATPRRFWSSFWFMSGLWCCVNVAIAVLSMVAPPATTEEFTKLLLINSGLDVLYLICGVVLVTRRQSIPRGFGATILLQGAALLVFDLVWWTLLTRG
ncbi:MAG: hypothetical protein AAGK04_06065 [Planctomycetota bacterium]